MFTAVQQQQNTSWTSTTNSQRNFKGASMPARSVVQRNKAAKENDAQASEWRLSGNLRGNPPVRSETPPNIAVVEDETTYHQLLSLAKKSLVAIKKMAESMLDGEEVKDHKYWFTRVYQYVTEGELDYVHNKAFYYPSYVLRSVIYFEKIYRDNVAAVKTNAVEKHWKTAFETSDEKKDDLWVDFMDAVEALVQSMLAHIRFDLPRAEAWIFNSYYKSQNNISITDFKADFMSMSGIFDKAGERMNEDIYTKFSWMAKGLMKASNWPLTQDLFMRYWHDADMTSERADTWRRAEMLTEKGLATDDPYKISNGEISGNVTQKDHQSNLGKLDGGLAAGMKTKARLDDDNVRKVVRNLSIDQIAKLPVSRRIRMLIGLLIGNTGNDDEIAIAKILDASDTKELITIIDGVSAWNLLYAVDNDNYKKLRKLLRESYYAHTIKQTAFRLIVRCMEGETAEWEEEMIMDILEARSTNDATVLIIEIGRRYEGRSYAKDTDYKNGINKLEWQLDGKEQDRLDKMFGAVY